MTDMLFNNPKRILLDDWQKEATSLFGPDVNGWRFKCPACGQVQTRKEFEDIGINPRMVDRVLGYSCIGKWHKRRHTKLPKTTRTMGGVVDFGQYSEGWGCIYEGGGSINISPTMLVISGTEYVMMFGWDTQQA